MRKGLFTMAIVAVIGANALVGCDDSGDSNADGGGGKAGGIVIPDGATAGTGGSVTGGSGPDGGTAGTGGSTAGDAGAADGSTDGGPAAFICEPGTAATNAAALNSTPPAATESMDKASTLPGPAYPNLPAL
jgi:hypothetical protein